MGSGGADAWRPCEDLAKEALSFVTFHEPKRGPGHLVRGTREQGAPSPSTWPQGRLRADGRFCLVLVKCHTCGYMERSMRGRSGHRGLRQERCSGMRWGSLDQRGRGGGRGRDVGFWVYFQSRISGIG